MSDNALWALPCLVVAALLAFGVIRWVFLRADNAPRKCSGAEAVYYGSVTVLGATMGVIPTIVLSIMAFAITIVR